jgi:hypothetical protein
VAVPDGYVVVREGVRIQRRTPALVAALLALPPSEGQSLLAWMVARRKVDAEEFARIVAEHNGHPGVRRLRMYAPMVAARAASKAELVARSILISGSVEGWEPNALVRGVDGQAKSADFLFSAEKLIVMVDGWRYHGDRSAFQMDRHDQNALIQAGYLVLRFTWQDLEHRPGYVLEQIAEARALARRRAGPGAS